jgi:glycosyltransferase involved in cell wall biosynthesis
MAEIFDDVSLSHLKTDSYYKIGLRRFWTFLIELYVLIIFNFFKKDKRSVRVFYAGGRPGNLGGPLVKIKRLNEKFPQKLFLFNVVYVLSNANYLSKSLIRVLKKNRIPIILNQNGIFHPGWYGDGWEIKNREMSQVYHSADYVFWQSQFCKETVDRFLGKREGPGEILYNAVDTNIFTPKKSLLLQPYTFLITGKIDDHLFYRLENPIKAIRNLIDMGLSVQIKIAGKLSERVKFRLDLLVKSLNLDNQVIIHGEYSQENAAEIYRSSDAYIMMKYLDSCPNVVLEAMSCGLPILYSLSGGLPELVGSEAGVGLYVPESWDKTYMPSSEEIVKGMINIMQNSTLLSEAARKRAVENFDISYWATKHQNIFNNFLELS